MLFLSIGCSNTHIIQPNESIHIKKYGTLFKKDSKRIDVSEFYSSGDSIIVLHRDTNELLEYSKLDVTKIVIWNRSKGAKQGGIAGALGAASLCYLSCSDNPQEALGGKAAGVFLWLFFGGFLGAPVGFLNGSNDVYEFITAKSGAKEIKKEPNNTDVDQTRPPAIVMIKDPEIEDTQVKEKMIAASKKPPKKQNIFYGLRAGVGFGGIPAIKNLDESSITHNSGLGIGGSYQLWFPVRSNIFIGLSAGGIEISEEEVGVTITRSVENFDLTTKIYPKKKNFYYEGTIGISRLSQRSRLTEDLSKIFDSSITGLGISAGMGTSLIRGEKYELLINGNVSFNIFDGGKRATLIGINLGVMFPRRNTI